ncbi:MAG: Anti-sigma-I factor RsgI [Firmicutes bacterium ADurb.Bin419]|nr:MAG: Anti-sigma-I factor RsgI [Firmicutes bacterium ADurb.Bin419]
MYTGLIFSIDKNTVLVATPDNAFYKLKRKSTMFVGQEIVFTKNDIIDYRYHIKRLAAVAAGLCIIMGVVALYLMNHSYDVTNSREFAYVSVDINPSLEFTIDETQKVLKVESMNDEAKEIIDSKNVKGMKVKSAITEVISMCEEKGIVDTDDEVYFLISGSLNPHNQEYKKDKSGAEDSLSYILDGLKGAIMKTNVNDPEIIALKTQPQYRAQARENNLSQGKYDIYSQLKKRGSEITIEEVKNATVKDLITIFIELNTTVSPTPKLTALPTPSEVQTPEISTLTPAVTLTITPTPAVTQNGDLPQVKNSQQPPDSEPKPTKGTTGTGLRGEYFDNIDLTNYKFTRVDGTIDFSWGTDSPAPEIRNDESYSIRWTGKIKPEYSEEYTFYVLRDNGVRLWIDNKLIIDKWSSEWSVTDMASLTLEAGKAYDIKIEYFNNTGYGFIKLEWSSKSTEKTVIPEKCLYPAEAIAPPNVGKGNGTGLNFEYFDNDNLTNLKLTGVDPEINFNWGVGSPDRVIEQDCKFSVRWKGYIQPARSEDYVFYVTQDDGVRLWIDDKLILDKWQGSEEEIQSAGIYLEAGKKYKILLEYHNSSLAGMVKLEWSSPSTKRSVVSQKYLFTH